MKDSINSDATPGTSSYKLGYYAGSDAAVPLRRLMVDEPVNFAALDSSSSKVRQKSEPKISFLDHGKTRAFDEFHFEGQALGSRETRDLREEDKPWLKKKIPFNEKYEGLEYKLGRNPVTQERVEIPLTRNFGEPAPNINLRNFFDAGQFRSGYVDGLEGLFRTAGVVMNDSFTSAVAQLGTASGYNSYVSGRNFFQHGQPITKNPMRTRYDELTFFDSIGGIVDKIERVDNQSARVLGIMAALVKDYGLRGSLANETYRALQSYTDAQLREFRAAVLGSESQGHYGLRYPTARVAERFPTAEARSRVPIFHEESYLMLINEEFINKPKTPRFKSNWTAESVANSPSAYVADRYLATLRNENVPSPREMGQRIRDLKK